MHNNCIGWKLRIEKIRGNIEGFAVRKLKHLFFGQEQEIKLRRREMVFNKVEIRIMIANIAETSEKKGPWTRTNQLHKQRLPLPCDEGWMRGHSLEDTSQNISKTDLCFTILACLLSCGVRVKNKEGDLSERRLQCMVEGTLEIPFEKIKCEKDEPDAVLFVYPFNSD